MNEENDVKATSNSSRIFENNASYSPGLLFLCPALSNVAVEAKNKETHASLFFSRRQRSKVIARVTRNSLIALSGSFRAYLALAEGSKPALHLPMVASVAVCPDALGHPKFHNIKYKCYGK